MFRIITNTSFQGMEDMEESHMVVITDTASSNSNTLTVTTFNNSISQIISNTISNITECILVQILGDRRLFHTLRSYADQVLINTIFFPYKTFDCVT